MKKFLLFIAFAAFATLHMAAQTSLENQKNLVAQLKSHIATPSVVLKDAQQAGPRRAEATTTYFAYNPISFFQSASGSTKDEYFMCFTNVPSNYNEVTSSIELSEAGMILYLDLYANNNGTDTKFAVIPSGEYIAGANSKTYTYDKDYSYVVVMAADGSSKAFQLDGIVKVSRNANYQYTIIAQYKDADGTLQTMQTTPLDINFRVNGGGETGHILPQINADVITDYNSCVGIYYGNLYQSNTGNMLVNLYTGSYDENDGTQTGPGYLVQLCLFNTLFGVPEEACLKAGTYTCKTNFSKFSYYPGIELTAYGITQILGCQVQKRDFQGNYTYSCITGGKVDIEENPDGTYTVVVDMTTDDNHVVKGSFTGGVRIIDYSDDKPATHVSNLTDDVALNLDQIPVARLWRMDDVMNNNEPFGRWTLDIGSRGGLDECINQNGGDLIRLELFSDYRWHNLVPFGTYEVLPNTYDQSVEIFTARPGYFYNGGDLTGTCYEHMEEGRYLVMDLLAPIAQGTVKLTDNFDGTTTIDMNFIDDAGFTIAGSWTGPVELQTARVEGEDGVEGILGVTGTQSQQPIYDLSGRRIAHPNRGIYIVNGQKVVK